MEEAKICVKIEFTEIVKPKKWILNLLVTPYLKKQQAQFVKDLKKVTE